MFVYLDDVEFMTTRLDNETKCCWFVEVDERESERERAKNQDRLLKDEDGDKDKRVQKMTYFWCIFEV